MLFFVFIVDAHEFHVSGAQDYLFTQIQDVEVLLHNMGMCFCEHLVEIVGSIECIYVNIQKKPSDITVKYTTNPCFLEKISAAIVHHRTVA
jgi:hypothetical protein